MALEAVPLLREDSILCWGKEATFKTVSADAAPWQSLGRVEEWTDLGPVKAVFREAIAGSGRQAATIGVGGTVYPQTTIGPFQVVDPRFLGFAWGEELAANGPTAIGGGYYRHTVTPTTNGQLPSMSVQMGDYKAGSLVDGMTYLGVIMPKLSLRGEEGNEDGTGGRVLAAPTLAAHDHSTATTAKSVTLPTSTPYYKQHASIQFYDTDVDWRIHSWEYSIDNSAKANYYHRSGGDKPFESPPEGVLHDLTLDIIADAHQAAGHAAILRDLAANETTGQGKIKYVRTANQDEFAVNLTDIKIESALKTRSKGKIHYEVKAYVRATSFEYVDQNAAAYYPT